MVPCCLAGKTSFGSLGLVLIWREYSFKFRYFANPDPSVPLVLYHNGGKDLLKPFFKKKKNKHHEKRSIFLLPGPGCSSMMALLYENGPFYIDENLQPQENNFSWTKKYHMLYIDSPVGTG
jgi:hypothetical protein